jgi:hypothetical protein
MARTRLAQKKTTNDNGNGTNGHDNHSNGFANGHHNGSNGESNGAYADGLNTNERTHNTKSDSTLSGNGLSFCAPFLLCECVTDIVSMNAREIFSPSIIYLNIYFVCIIPVCLMCIPQAIPYIVIVFNAITKITVYLLPPSLNMPIQST